jgi:hypothetical protein
MVLSSPLHDDDVFQQLKNLDNLHRSTMLGNPTESINTVSIIQKTPKIKPSTKTSVQEVAEAVCNMLRLEPFPRSNPRAPLSDLPIKLAHIEEAITSNEMDPTEKNSGRGQNTPAPNRMHNQYPQAQNSQRNPSHRASYPPSRGNRFFQNHGKINFGNPQQGNNNQTNT